jgi:hypothetical protein
MTAGEKYYADDLAKGFLYSRIGKNLNGKAYGLIAKDGDVGILYNSARRIKKKYSKIK